MAAQPDPGSRLLQGILVSRNHASRPLQQVASSGRHVPKLRRRAAQNRFDRTA
jgi:hypothetical protein